MAPRYKAPRGTQDVLPEDSWRWQRVEAAFRDTCLRYGYGEIRTPLFEETDLFVHGTGPGTEIVNKQMYTFEDRGGRSLTLRPEGTPSVVRAYLERKLTGVQKLYYVAPIFRYERPQAGRYRQHTQLGVEAIGVPGPDVDAEVIALFHDFVEAIGLQGAVTHLGSIGCPNCRPALSAALREFFGPKLEDLCDFCRARYEANPLRILDCKVPADIEARRGAPSALDHLCEECRGHFAGVRAALDALAVPYEVDPTIVRGLDYYSRTAFEVAHPSLGAKDVIMGGGRYDGLAEMLGGSPTPGIGFGSGLERLLLVLDAAKGPVEQESLLPARAPEVYVAAASDEARRPAFLRAMQLRRKGIAVAVDYLGRSLKAQMKEAARLGVPFVVLLGEDELAAGRETVRPMASGKQQQLAPEDFERKAAAVHRVTTVQQEVRAAELRDDADAAIRAQEGVVGLWRDLASLEPAFEWQTSMAEGNLAERYADTGSIEQAIEWYEHVQARLEAMHPERPPAVPPSLDDFRATVIGRLAELRERLLRSRGEDAR